MQRNSRIEILKRLHHTIDAGVPIIGAGAGAGISAKFEEEGGVDRRKQKEKQNKSGVALTGC